MKLSRQWIEQDSFCNVRLHLYAEFDWLKEEQHDELIFTAMHEAAHMVMAFAVGGYVGHRAYIRIPKRRSKYPSSRSVLGSVRCGGYDNATEAMISLAGIIASFQSKDPNALQVTRGDQRDYRELAGDMDRQKQKALRRKAIELSLMHWTTIEASAKAMLRYCKKTGDLEGSIWEEIKQYAIDQVSSANKRMEDSIRFSLTDET